MIVICALSQLELVLAISRQVTSTILLDRTNRFTSTYAGLHKLKKVLRDRTNVLVLLISLYPVSCALQTPVYLVVLVLSEPRGRVEPAPPFAQCGLLWHSCGYHLHLILSADRPTTRSRKTVALHVPLLIYMLISVVLNCNMECSSCVSPISIVK